MIELLSEWLTQANFLFNNSITQSFNHSIKYSPHE